MQVDEMDSVEQGRSDEQEHVPDVEREAVGASGSARQAAPRGERPAVSDADVDWRDAALRLKAEMENYRKRQKRWADDEILREKERLLGQFLGIVDNLEAALAHLDRGDAVHQGVQVAYDAMLVLLLREGVERIFAKGRPFDPTRHEAVAVVPARRDGRDAMHVIEVTSPGYMFADRVLRPAKVVVAKEGA
jgi:molecular chaperone GrpE